jgi:N6-adenosine-specific RNA methylase IME4
VTVDVWAGLNPPYRTIVADPPWPYRLNSGRMLTTSNKRTTRPDLQYGRMTLDEIAALPVNVLAADAAHLYLWVTNPLLRQGFDILDTLTWRKIGTLGLGFRFRGETEHVLFGERGSLPIPPERRARNWIEAPRRGHSTKPPELMDVIERCSPGPYVELFARSPRIGWDHWGHGWETA